MKLTRRINNQQGQAVMEYILVLIVLVFVFLILLQFNRQFRQWGEDYFIAYYRCLLETGELPSLGGQSAVAGICSSQFQPFTLASGWQPYPGGAGYIGGGASGGGASGGGASGGGGGNNNAGSSQRSTGENAGNVRGGEVSRVGGSAGSGGGGGASRQGKFNASSSNDNSRGGPSRKKEGIYTGSNETTNFNSKSQTKSKIGKSQNLDYGYGIRREDQVRGTESVKVNIKKQAEGEKKEQRFKLLKKRVEQKTQLEEDEFTFGNFFRLLIIAAIIIALGVLIGGQLLQISKGMDAEG